MASHSVAIAKASLAASLMRPEPYPLSRTDIAQFHCLLDALLSQCSATNIQLCKEWLLKHTSPSTIRTGAVGKYLVALSASLSTCTSTSSSDQARKAKVSCRRQLNILYLLHDTLHHTKFHDASLTDTAAFNQILEAHVTQLVALASAYDPVKYIQHFRKLKDLIDIWSEGGYYSVSHVAALQETIANASSCSDVSIQYLAPTEGSRGTEYAVTGDSRRDAPYIMPSSHGDISTPFYDLPAGNLMPCIVPNSLYPIKPQAMKPVALRAGPADEKLVHVVKSFLHDADTIYGTNRPGNNIETWDIDELGQLILPNDLSGGRSGGEGYYGWSESFCEKMKLRDIEKPIVGSLLQHHQVDLDSRRKRRYSYSDSSRNQSPSRTASRSPSNERRARRMRRRRSDSDSRSRSRSRLQHSSGSRNPRVTLRARSDSLRSRTRSYSPPDVEAPGDCRAGSGKESITATGNGGSLQTSSPTPAFLHQGFFGPGQIPVPPPRPPNYHGPWPPPPPVPPGYNVSSIPASALHGQQSGHYTTQGHQGGIGNLTSLASQPWNRQNDTAASQGRGSRAH